MLRNYFTIAIRTLWKNKIFSAINICGLAIGISASLVIYLLVNYHFRFNNDIKDNQRIYRVVSNFSSAGELYRNSGVTDPMAYAVSKELTGLDAVIPFRTHEEDARVNVPAVNKNAPAVFKRQTGIVFADSNYFNLVSYQWLAGSPKTALLNPYQTVLTSSNAALYFPGVPAAEIIGKEIIFNDTVRAVVTGIVKDLSANNDFTFKTFIAYTTLEKTSLRPVNWRDWDNTNGAQQLFVKLSADTKPQQFEAQLAQLYTKYHKKSPGDNSVTTHNLQPLHDLHFNPDFGAYSVSAVSKPTLYGLLAVAAFLLLLGCINFINLTTAQASQRAKEIGIRKTMGSSKKQLILQFLSETFLLTLIATILSTALTPLILQAFSGFIPEDLHIDIATQPGIVIFLFLLTMAVTLLSGFYPAWVLSAGKPVLVLKNQSFAGSGNTRKAVLRKTLTVSQFVIAQVFIMATLLVSKQIQYSLRKDMGFKKDAIVNVNIEYRDTSQTNKSVFMNKLRAIPEIAMVAMSTSPPSSYSTWSSSITYHDGKKEIETDVQQKYGDTNYIKLYRLQLLAGKNFEQTDTVNTVLINQTYAGILGFREPQQAIGKNLRWGNSQIPIVGVVADFNQHSLREHVKPMIISSRSPIERTIAIALQPQNESGNTWKTAITKIEKVWKEVYPQYDFEYRFFDAEIEKYYTAEKNTSSLLVWATGLAVFISCLGLLGLVIFITTQRTKEIGVRKVLGASVSQIVTLISKDFLLLVIVAFAIAVPLAWIGMHQWLDNFAYRTTISWWIFLLGGCVMGIMALITLGFQTVRAASANPVKSLRTE